MTNVWYRTILTSVSVPFSSFLPRVASHRCRLLWIDYLVRLLPSLIFMGHSFKCDKCAMLKCGNTITNVVISKCDFSITLTCLIKLEGPHKILIVELNITRSVSMQKFIIVFISDLIVRFCVQTQNVVSESDYLAKSINNTRGAAHTKKKAYTIPPYRTNSLECDTMKGVPTS